MKRRQFIQKTTLSAVALAMPWSKITAQALIPGPETYKGNKDEIFYEISIYNGITTEFATTAAENKIVKISAAKMINKETKEYRADLKVKAVDEYKNKTTGAMDEYKIETAFLQVNKKEIDLPKELNINKLTLIYNDKNDSLTILDKKGKEFIILQLVKSESGGSGCFLTTACVNILGKTDDCAELTTLRKFRDEVLKSSETGKKLIADYYNIAPDIVNAISLRSDKHAVYTDIYNQMIMPTIQCIEKDDKRGAISIYKNYTLNLKSRYL